VSGLDPVSRGDNLEEVAEPWHCRTSVGWNLCVARNGAGAARIGWLATASGLDRARLRRVDRQRLDRGRKRAAWLERPGPHLVGRPVDPLDLGAVEAPAELDGKREERAT
jgi:hypothetical protein